MSKDNQSEPTGDRLRRAMWRPLSSENRASQLAAIESALGDSTQVVPIRSRRRTRLLAVAAAILILPSGLAIAAESALPGDSLYPVKRATESVRGLVNPDIAAEHRVEELESLVAMDAAPDDIRSQLERAKAEVALLPSMHLLQSRLDFIALSLSVEDQSPTDRLSDDAIEAAERKERPSDTAPSTTTRRDTTTTRRADTATSGQGVVSDAGPDSGDDTGSNTTSPTTSVATATTTTATPTTTTAPPTTTTTTKPKDVQQYRVSGYVHAGPVCPVERFPPDPDCADRPVEGAVMLFTTDDGKEVGQAVSDANGRFALHLPNGSYVLRPQPVEGLLGTAPAQRFTVDGAPVELDVAYDTGIR